MEAVEAGGRGPQPLRWFTSLLLTFAWVCSLAVPASAEIFYFSTGEPDGLMAVASHPAGTYTDENEAADDFTLDSETLLIGATFYGLLPYDSSPEDIGDVIVEIYRVFPNDSDPDREIQVPTRANSPSDVAFDSRAASEGRGTPISVFSLVGGYSHGNVLVESPVETGLPAGCAADPWQAPAEPLRAEF